MNYEKFLFDPFGKDTVSKLEQYEEFKFECDNKDKVIAYLILMYDLSSSEVKAHSDRLYERKKFAALRAGFKFKDGVFPKDIEDIIVGENDDFNVAMIRYVRMFGLPDLPKHTAYNEMLDSELSAAAKERDYKLHKVIMDNIESLSVKIESIERKIFTGDETENVRKSLYRLMEKTRVPRPEYMAQDIASKSLDLPDKYELQK